PHAPQQGPLSQQVLVLALVLAQISTRLRKTMPTISDIPNAALPFCNAGKKSPDRAGDLKGRLSANETNAGYLFRLDCRAGCHACQGLVAAGPAVGRHLAVRSCVPGPAAVDRALAVHHAAGRFGRPAGAAGCSSDLAFGSYGCSWQRSLGRDYFR